MLLIKRLYLIIFIKINNIVSVYYMPNIVKYGFIYSKNLILPKPYDSYNFYPHVTGEETKI